MMPNLQPFHLWRRQQGEKIHILMTQQPTRSRLVVALGHGGVVVETKADVVSLAS
eukprot:CAMPEP_0175813308 /NCGR_PEP_ID=MMETSP0107_2-20121207/4833_1 /TAXON_ID=195067 ORGANISM="Goniomonas pacifica, Strain CCMP1869" /NCGR_SAMPLE_ID=MMETSP0107_2 /ASSEMBLY_ACC=CAM_ASM_000203 /LENGTH=54 /DNA_ID=CAMNT_0017125213 /DNA_START=303 /DNA_END=467 /DNA_ORIENTATION=+